MPVGHPGNTGDAVRLALGAGASLWHMGAFFGWFAFVHPDHVAGFPLDVHGPSFIYVDADGRRFADETGWEVHDKVRSLTAYLPRRRNYPHMPGHLVFDERARVAGPLNGIVGTPNDYTWSADNTTEVEAGWITRADTPDALAHAIGRPSCRPRWRRMASAPTRSTARSRRSSRSRPALRDPHHPGVATASGGPRRDDGARVLVPTARRSGSVRRRRRWSGVGLPHRTRRGLTDAIVFGRIAGANAAGVSPQQSVCTEKIGHTLRSRVQLRIGECPCIGECPSAFRHEERSAFRHRGGRLNYLLDVHALRVSFGGVTAVDNVDVKVPEGVVFGLIGPNGAGKTSMVDALTGYTGRRLGRVVSTGGHHGGASVQRARMGWLGRFSRSSCSTT